MNILNIIELYTSKWLSVQYVTHWKRLWCWERFRSWEGGNRGWGGGMASLTQGTWVWANSRRWWRTGKPAALQSMGLQRVRHNWAAEQQTTKSRGGKDDPWGKEKEYILSTRFYVYVNTVEVHNTEKTNQNYHYVRGGSLARWRQGQECDFTRYSLQVLFFWFWGFFGHGSKHVESYFTDQGWNLRPLQRKWKHGVLTAEPPEKFPTGSEICGSVACSKIKKKKKKRKSTKTPLMAHPY